MAHTRIARLGKLLAGSGLDAVVVLPGPNLYYLTGLAFHLFERPILAFFLADQQPHFVLPELEQGKVHTSGIQAVVHPYGEDEDSRMQAFRRAASTLGLAGRRLGVEPLRMRLLELRLLETAAPGVQFLSGDDTLYGLRQLKDEYELASMRKAVDAAQKALDSTLPLIRVGMSERELASELSLQLLRAGSHPDTPFAPIVASGPNSALPHATASDRRLQPGDALILDWGANVDGYISDLTRTFAVSEPDPELARVYEIVRQANAAGRAAVRPDVSCGEIDRAARAVIEQAGLGGQFTHRTGHGIGLESHEPPYIRFGNTQRLLPGMTFTVEPGVYLEGRGGARLEDNMLVTDGGGESLSNLARELRVVA